MSGKITGEMPKSTNGSRPGFEKLDEMVRRGEAVFHPAKRAPGKGKIKTFSFGPGVKLERLIKRS